MDTLKAEWSSAYITALPDSAFACIDSEGRHYPHHNAAGNLDLAHLRNALSRVNQEATTSCGKSHLMAHARAEGMGDTMKAEQLGSNKWRVLAIPFGGPMKGGRDLDGEWFDHDTDIKARWFKERPVLFHHGQDREVGDEDLGVEDDLVEAKDGWWATMWLDRSHRYWSQVDALIRAGKMFGSSGAVSHLVRKSKSGHIDVWPHAEQTLTPTPANPYARITASKALAGFDSAGIEVDDKVKSLLEELDRRGDDLRTDLPDPGDPSGDLGDGGDDEARARLVARTDYLKGLLKTI